MEYWLCAFSILAFFLAPGGLGRWVWLLPGGFAGLNLYLFFAPEWLLPRSNPLIYLVISQGPWLLFCLDLIARGKAHGVVERISLRSWVLWPFFQLMGIGFVFAAYAGDLPPEFALRTAFSGILIALGALGFWIFHRPENIWYRSLLLFWNTYGFITILATGTTLLRSQPGFPFASQSPLDLSGYFSGFPQEWIPLFWLPVSMIIHCAIFFKLFESGKNP